MNRICMLRKSAVILLASDLVLKEPIDATLIRVDDPYEAFAKLLNIYQQYKQPAVSGISKMADVKEKR